MSDEELKSAKTQAIAHTFAVNTGAAEVAIISRDKDGDLSLIFGCSRKTRETKHERDALAQMLVDALALLSNGDVEALTK